MYGFEMKSSKDVELEPIEFDDGNLRMDIYQPVGYILPRAYRSLRTPMLQFPIRDDDVWIVSHPRCGTTWTSEMTWMIRHNLDYEAAKTDIGKRVPFIEHESLFLNHGGKMDEILRQKAPRHIAQSFDYVGQWKTSDGPRTIRTHIPWQLLPENLRKSDSPAKIIYVSREPKDVCISYYHHYKLFADYRGTLEDFAESFLCDKLVNGPFWVHLLEFWERRHQQNILFLKYEDMKKDLSSIIRLVDEFLNLPPRTVEQMEELKNHLSFKSMKDNDAVNKSKLIQDLQEKGKLCEANSGERFIRKGIVGDWKNEMSPDLVRKFDQWTAEKTAGTDFTF